MLETLHSIEQNIVDIPTDENLARLAREELEPLLAKMVSVMNKYRQRGLVFGISMPFDQIGRYRVAPIEVSRPL